MEGAQFLSREAGGMAYVPARDDEKRRVTVDRERLELALEMGGLGQFEWDLVRDLVVLSPAAAALIGAAAGQGPFAGPRGFSRYVHPEDRAAVAALAAPGAE